MAFSASSRPVLSQFSASSQSCNCCTSVPWLSQEKEAISAEIAKVDGQEARFQKGKTTKQHLYRYSLHVISCYYISLQYLYNSFKVSHRFVFTTWTRKVHPLAGGFVQIQIIRYTFRKDSISWYIMYNSHLFTCESMNYTRIFWKVNDLYTQTYPQ